METIVEHLEIGAVAKESEYLSKLKAGGFISPVAGFPVITLDAIKKYLEDISKKTLESGEAYKGGVFYENGESDWNKKQNITLHIWSYIVSKDVEEISAGLFSIKTQMVKRDTNLYSQWRETPIKGFKCLPPTHILDSVSRAKDKFDEIKIVTVEARVKPKDPLVVGINKGDADRYLIDWWDTDIDPSELV